MNKRTKEAVKRSIRSLQHQKKKLGMMKECFEILLKEATFPQETKGNMDVLSRELTSTQFELERLMYSLDAALVDESSESVIEVVPA